MAAICFVKNVSSEPIPKEGMKPPTFNGNDGYTFAPGETKALSEAEGEFLCRNIPNLKMVARHGETGSSIPDSIMGTAKALETFGLGKEGQPGKQEKASAKA